MHPLPLLKLLETVTDIFVLAAVVVEIAAAVVVTAIDAADAVFVVLY